MNYPNKGLSILRKGRVSVLGARYFVSANIADRSRNIATMEVWREFQAKACALREAGMIDDYAWVLMPDHFHGAFVLKETTLGIVLKRLKGGLVPILRKMRVGWQDGYHDHRLRPEEELAPYLRYMLANPYRKNLLPLSETWPYWRLAPEVREWFLPLTDHGRPHREWLEQSKPWEDCAAGGAKMDGPTDLPR